MTFLAQYSQFMLLKLEQSEIQHKMMIAQKRMMQLDTERSELEQMYDSLGITDTREYNPDDEAYYRYLEKESNHLSRSVESYENLNNAINTLAQTMKSQVENGIKDSCGMTFNGGK